MAETLVHSTPLPQEIIVRTDRFWFRSPEVALGTYREAGELFYWKWNLKSARWRLTSFQEDKHFVIQPEILKAIGSGDVQILRYKPESRLAYCSLNLPHRMVKLYATEKAKRGKRLSKVFSDSFERAAPVQPLNSVENGVEWDWIEGRPMPLDKQDDESVLRLLNTKRALSREDVDFMEPARIAQHLHDRIEAHRAWIPLLLPSATADFTELTQSSNLVLTDIGKEAVEPDPRLLHGDFRARNTIFDSLGRVFLCDSDHLCAGPIEWDLAAWAADTSFYQPDHATSLLSSWFSLPEVDAQRLSNYFRAWRILIGLRSLEERNQ